MAIPWLLKQAHSKNCAYLPPSYAYKPLFSQPSPPFPPTSSPLSYSPFLLPPSPIQINTSFLPRLETLTILSSPIFSSPLLSCPILYILNPAKKQTNKQTNSSHPIPSLPFSSLPFLPPSPHPIPPPLASIPPIQSIPIHPQHCLLLLT